MKSALPVATIPARFLPQFSFLQQLRIVYFHSLLRRIGANTHNRIVAITSNGETGIFTVDGGRRAAFSLETDVAGIAFNHKCVFLALHNAASDGDAGETIVALDFDLSGANIRGNETKEMAIKKFLGIVANFLAPGTPVRKVSPNATAAVVQTELLAAQEQQLLQEQAGGAVMQGRAPGQSIVSNRNANILSGSNSPPTSPTGTDGGTVASGGANNKSSITDKMFKSFSWIGNKFSFGGGKGPNGGAASPSSGDDGDYDDGRVTSFADAREATVTAEEHERQRKRVRRWHEEVLSRMGEREGLDAKERILDDVARLEAQLKKQRALTEAPQQQSPEEELRQQRALAALVMFICRRQTMLAEAKMTRIPQMRPAQGSKQAASAAGTEPASVPVLPSYVDAFRSVVLGM